MRRRKSPIGTLVWVRRASRAGLVLSCPVRLFPPMCDLRLLFRVSRTHISEDVTVRVAWAMRVLYNGFCLVCFTVYLDALQYLVSYH
jgi:hypothetical protein